MRIARPILLVSTPIGLVLGLLAAWQIAGARMALLMAAMVGLVGAFLGWTLLRIRQERERPPVDAARPLKPSAPGHEPQPHETQRKADDVR